MKKKIFLGLLLLILAVSLTLVGCAKPAPEQKTLKIGFVGYLGGGMQLDMKRTMELMADMDNKNGGMDIGGERYNVQIITYDSNNNQATEVSAVNRLVYEDNVKFIACDGMAIGAWLPTTEENKVLVGSLIPVPQITLTPNLLYSFHPFAQTTTGAVVTGWFCENYPDKAKDYALALPDDPGGHRVEPMLDAAWKSFGVTPTFLYYPASAADLSALGTKVKTLNPGAFGATAGGAADALIFKTVWQAGYRGQFFVSSGDTALAFLQVAPAEALEGLICPADPVEFDPAVTQAAQEFKDAWIAEYGKWEGTRIGGTSYYACLKAALQQAGSLDTDKVAAVLFNGMKFEAPTGSMQMISRPDVGNDRTVDSITTVCIKQIRGGEPTLLTTVGIDEGLRYFRKANPPGGGAAPPPPLPPPP